MPLIEWKTRPIDPDRCGLMVWSGDSRSGYARQCTRPIAGNLIVHDRYVAACRFHINLEDRERAKEQARQAREQSSDDALTAAKTACDQLKRFGIDASPDYVAGIGYRMGRYNGKVVVDPSQVLAALLLKNV